MTAPRRRSTRIALAALIGLAIIVTSAAPEAFVDEATHHDSLGWIAGGILPSLLGAWLAPKVGYRRRDALILLTMGLSAIPSSPLLVKLIWRTAALPHRDWPEPPPEPPPPPPVVETPPGPPWARDVTSGNVRS